MNLKQVELQQRDMLNSIYACKEPVSESQEATGILPTIRSFSEEDAACALGELGCKLRNFALAVDLRHPDLQSIYSGQLCGTKEGTLSRSAADLLKLSVAARDLDASNHVRQGISKLLCKSIDNDNPTGLIKALTDHLDNPFNNLLYVRLVPDQRTRDVIRTSKVTQDVGLSSMASKGTDFWDKHPDDFASYSRGVNRYQQDIVQAEERKSHFLRYGLTHMAGEIQKSIDEYNEKSQSQMHYGFNKISLVTASVILAKLCGYQFEAGSHYMDPAIYAYPDTFGDYVFYDDDCVPFERIDFRPRAYSLHEFEGSIPESMRKIVDFLESFPEAAGRPIFDHYRILIPGIDYPKNWRQTTPYHYKRKDGTEATFQFCFEAQKDLGRELLQSGSVPGILLGETDGDHYFVSYWM